MQVWLCHHITSLFLPPQPLLHKGQYRLQTIRDVGSLPLDIVLNQHHWRHLQTKCCEVRPGRLGWWRDRSRDTGDPAWGAATNSEQATVNCENSPLCLTLTIVQYDKLLSGLPRPHCLPPLLQIWPPSNPTYTLQSCRSAQKEVINLSTILCMQVMQRSCSESLACMPHFTCPSFS